MLFKMALDYVLFQCMLWVGSSQTQSRLYDICKVPEITESGTLLTPNRVTGQQARRTRSIFDGHLEPRE